MVEIAGVKAPRSNLARDITGFVQDAESQLPFHHSNSRLLLGRPDRGAPAVTPLEIRPERLVAVHPSTRKVHPMYRIPILLLPLVALLVAAAGPDGSVIAHNGNGHGALACTTCHGQNFQGTPTIHAPALAGLSAATILARLAHYAGPTGHNAMMRQVATALSPAERRAVAHYLASLPKPH